MKITSKTLAEQLAHSLDANDTEGSNGKIEASVWNKFVSDKGGKNIKSFISADDAIKSILTYLNRQANNREKQIKELGQKWLKGIDEFSDGAEKTQQVTQSNTNGKQNSTNKKRINNKTLKNVDTSYAKLSRDKALKKAAKDPRLERLKGGNGWSVSLDSFITDIPYAKKHTGAILSFVSSIIGENLVVTSALGTHGTRNNRTPHKVTQNYCTHHNAENPKLDIRSNGHPKKLQKMLLNTGLFARVSIEPDHLDIQIKPEVYAAFENGYNMKNILANAKSNNLMNLLV